MLPSLKMLVLPLAASMVSREAGCEPTIISFFLPLGIAINMNGIALYEATTALFIAQAHGVFLGPAEIVVVAATASLAAIGAPAIPSAGLVTILPCRCHIPIITRYARSGNTRVIRVLYITAILPHSLLLHLMITW